MNAPLVSVRTPPAYSARSYVIALALIVAIPLLLVSAWLIYRSMQLERAELAARMVQIVDDLAQDVDRELSRHVTLLRTLAALPAVRQSNLAEFHAQAQEVANDIGLGLFLIDPTTKRVVVSTLRPYGETLPLTANVRGLEQIQSGRAYDISNLFIGAVSKRAVFDVSVPVLRDGKAIYVLSLALEPRHLLPILQGQKLEPEWITLVWDGAGTILTRSRDQDAFVGKTVSDDQRAQPPRTVSNEVSADGNRFRRVVTRSSYAGWGFALVAPASGTESQLRSSLIVLSFATAGALVSAILLGVVFGRGISRPLSLSSAAAAAMGRGEPIAASHSYVQEVNTINAALDTAQRELHAREANLKYLSDRLSAAAAAAEFGGYDFDVRAGTAQWTPQLRQLLGAEDMTGNVTFDVAQTFMHPDERQQTESRMRDIIARAASKYELEFRVVRRSDGQTRWMLDRGGVIAGPDGKAERAVGVLIDITGRKNAEQRQQLLLRELDHRVKNTLAVVQSIASQTLRTRRDPEHFVTAFASRIGSLARSHDLLTENVWSGAALDDVVAAALETFQSEAKLIETAGPPAALNADDTVSLSLLIHELATNAAKYGALSAPGGRLQVMWSLSDEGDRQVVDLQWQETGGPAVTPPKTQGFGLRLIKGLAGQLNGTITIDYPPDGWCCVLRFPLRRAPTVSPAGSD